MISYYSHNGNGDQRHNLRHMQHYDPDRIDMSKYCEPFKHEDCKKFYEEFFKKDLEEFNKKQKRKDRQILNYYDYVNNNKNFAIKKGDYKGKGQPFREILLTIGDKTLRDLGTLETYKEPFYNLCKEITDKWEDWYPNFKLLGSYLHIDEQGCYHLHLDYIPIAYNQTKGLKTQYSFTKALDQMGFKTEGETHEEQVENCGQKKFSEDWDKRLNELFIKYNLQVKPYDHERKAERKTTQEYKKEQEQVDKKIEEIANKKILGFQSAKSKAANEMISLKKEREQMVKDNNRVLKNEYNKLHKNELQERVNIQTKNNELSKKYNSNLEQYKKSAIAIKNQNEKLKTLNDNIETQSTKLENIKNEIDKETITLTELQEQEVKKQVEEKTKTIKEEYQTKLDQLNNDNSKTFKQLATDRLLENVELTEENERLKSTIKVFFDLVKTYIEDVLIGIFQFMKKFNPKEHDTLQEIIKKPTKQKDKGFSK